MDRMQENVTQVKDIINNNIHLHQNAEISEALDELTEDNYQHVRPCLCVSVLVHSAPSIHTCPCRFPI